MNFSLFAAVWYVGISSNRTNPNKAAGVPWRIMNPESSWFLVAILSLPRVCTAFNYHLCFPRGMLAFTYSVNVLFDL